MKKEFLKVMAIAIFFSGMERAAYAQPLTPCYNLSAKIKQIDNKIAQVDLVLPSIAEVILKSEEESKSGRLINIDDKQIRLEVASEIQSINLTDIKQILFRGYAILNERKIAIRGNDNIDLSSLTEKLSNFQLVNPSNGEATLQLTSISNPEEVLQGNQDNFYIVNKMSFESPEIIHIQYKVQP